MLHLDDDQDVLHVDDDQDVLHVDDDQDGDEHNEEVSTQAHEDKKDGGLGDFSGFSGHFIFARGSASQVTK